MAKVTRSLLKGLVKECLVEILTEGLAGSDTLVESRNRQPAPKPRRQTSTRKHPTNFMEVNTGPITEHVQERIETAAGDNDVMRDILTDTATRTLPNMVAADKPEAAGMAQRMVRGDPAVQTMAAVDPMDLFEGASNWATLAFSGGKAPTNS